MKANELRIGNLVNYRVRDNLDPRKEWLQYTQIDWQDLRILSHNMGDGFEPIEITKDWLHRLGFEYNDMILTWSHQDQYLPSLTLTNNGTYIIDGMAYSPELRYVHQLQNLFFALTGKELELKQ